MPITPDNIRRVFWDPAPTSPASPNIWRLRWREVGTTNWNLHPFELNTSEALFGVNVANEALSPGYTYIAILELGKDYEVQVQHKCSNTNFSAWSSSTYFDTYLTCPAFSTSPFTGTSPLAPYWVEDISSVLHPTRVRILWGYNAKGSLVWPKMSLAYRLQGSSTWTNVNYPRNGSFLELDLPSAGTYEFRLSSECKPTSPSSLITTSIHTFTLVGSYPPPTALRVRPTNTGGRFYWLAPTQGSPASTAPVIDYRYRINSGPWVNLGSTSPQFNYTGVSAGGSPTSYTIDIQAVYAGNNYSSSLTLTWKTAPQTDTIGLGVPVTTTWVPVGSNLSGAINNDVLTGTLGLIGSITATQSGHTPLSVVTIDNSSPGTNIIAQVVHTNGNTSTYNPQGDYALPDSNTSFPVTGGTIILERDTGYLRFVGTLTANSSGVISVTLPAVVNWDTRRWANP